MNGTTQGPLTMDQLARVTRQRFGAGQSLAGDDASGILIKDADVHTITALIERYRQACPGLEESVAERSAVLSMQVQAFQRSRRKAR